MARTLVPSGPVAEKPVTVLQLGKPMTDEDIVKLAHWTVDNGRAGQGKIHSSIELSNRCKFNIACPGGLHVPKGETYSEAVQYAITVIKDLIAGRIIPPSPRKEGLQSLSSR